MAFQAVWLTFDIEQAVWNVSREVFSAPRALATKEMENFGQKFKPTDFVTLVLDPSLYQECEAAALLKAVWRPLLRESQVTGQPLIDMRHMAQRYELYRYLRYDPHVGYVVLIAFV